MPGKTSIINSIIRQERQRISLKQAQDPRTVKLRQRLLKEELKLINRKKRVKAKGPKRSTTTETSGNVKIINRDNLEKFLESLDRRPEPAQKELIKCTKHMNTGARVPWMSPLFVLKAIRDCIFNRKWDNLTELLLILVNIPTKRYTPIIRHMCRILETLHPAVIENDLQGQFELIHKVYGKKKWRQSLNEPVVV